MFAKFDVFLSHNSSDKPAVEEIARKLVQAGLNPWLDKWNLIPGDPWQVAIEDALSNCTTCAVFIGPSGIGPWHNEEMRAAINRRVSESQGRFRVIPVLLPGATREERSRLPTFLTAATWVEFRQSLDEEDPFRRLLCGIRGIAPGPGLGEAVYEGVDPYRGLQVFDVEHAPFFFGREALTEWLLNALGPQKTPGGGETPGVYSGNENRFLGIIGASGSGKSSLARAGLMAALQRGKLPGSDAWPMAIFRPGADPLESLVTALTDIAKLNPSDALRLQDDLATRESLLHLTIRMALRDASPDRRAVILVDQFEEVFTLCRNETLRRGLIDNLIYAGTIADGNTIVVLTLRADFYGKCADYPGLAAALSDHQLLVGGMTPEELRLAIERPAQLAGGEFEPGLVDVLLKDMRDQAGGLPLLQFALLELWRQRAGRRLTQAAYTAIGGVEGALEKRAETVFRQFTEAEQQLCRQIFLRLTPFVTS
jgi:energy-coupling factor transporter ATP-binding protein EcfA2